MPLHRKAPALVTSTLEPASKRLVLLRSVTRTARRPLLAGHSPCSLLWGQGQGACFKVTNHLAFNPKNFILVLWEHL